MVEIKTNKELANYIKELESDVELNIQNLREKALLCSSIRAKWLSYYYKEKENLDRAKQFKSKLLKQKLGQSTIKDSVLKLKNEENILNSDEKFQKLTKLIEITQTNIDYIERALDILANFGFSIKNATELVKLNA